MWDGPGKPLVSMLRGVEGRRSYQCGEGNAVECLGYLLIHPREAEYQQEA